MNIITRRRPAVVGYALYFMGPDDKFVFFFGRTPISGYGPFRTALDESRGRGRRSLLRAERELCVSTLARSGNTYFGRVAIVTCAGGYDKVRPARNNHRAEKAREQFRRRHRNRFWRRQFFGYRLFRVYRRQGALRNLTCDTVFRVPVIVIRSRSW